MGNKGRGKGTPMTPKAAARIQSNTDRTGKDPGFKQRAQAAAARNTTPTGGGQSNGGNGSGQ